MSNEIKYKNGSSACIGDVIRWNCWDSDDIKTWTFTGLVKSGGVVYLGGGIDFGSGIGKVLPYDEVIAESENNDDFDSGIEKIGVVSELNRYISDFIGVGA
jgi:hypothetical protein